MSRRYVLSLVVVLSMLLVTSGLAAAADVIKIGSVGPLTGDIATFGQSVYNAVKMAFDEVNAAGGVLGKKIEFIHEDNKGDAAETTNIVRKLIVRDRISALVGAVVSANSLAAGPIAQQFRVPMITPTSTNEKVTEAGDYVFRVCFIDSFQGKIMARFAYNNLGYRKVATLTNIASDYSMGLTDVFTRTFESLGGQIVEAESYNSGDQDFRAQLTKIKAANPEAIYLPAYYTDVALIARQARQLGIDAVLLGPDGFDSPKLVEIGGEAVYGSYFTNHYSPEDQSPKVQRFVTAYKERYGQVPDALAALGYDAALVLIDAIKRAGSADRKAIRDALAQTKGIEVVTGVLSIDENRNPVKSAVILQVTENGVKFVDRVNP